MLWKVGAFSASDSKPATQVAGGAESANFNGVLAPELAEKVPSNLDPSDEASFVKVIKALRSGPTDQRF